MNFISWIVSELYLVESITIGSVLRNKQYYYCQNYYEMNNSPSLKLKIVYIDFGRLCYNYKKYETTLYYSYKNVLMLSSQWTLLMVIFLNAFT